MLMKKCPRCHRMMPYGPAYCSDCMPLATAELAAIKEENAKKKAFKYNRSRDSKYLTFYRSKDWRLLSKTYLQAKGYRCEACLTKDCTGLAVEVHHVKPIQTPEGWDLRLDWDNLEAVCTSCHNARHPEKLKRHDPPGVIDLRKIER